MIRRTALASLFASALGAIAVATKRLFGGTPLPRLQMFVNDRKVSDVEVGEPGDSEPFFEFRAYPDQVEGTISSFSVKGFDIRSRFLIDPNHPNKKVVGHRYEALREGTEVVVGRFDHIHADYSGPTIASPPLGTKEVCDFMNPKPEPRPKPRPPSIPIEPSEPPADVIQGGPIKTRGGQDRPTSGHRPHDTSRREPPPLPVRLDRPIEQSDSNGLGIPF